MRALEFITSHVIYNPYKFQLKTTQCLSTYSRLKYEILTSIFLFDSKKLVSTTNSSKDLFVKKQKNQKFGKESSGLVESSPLQGQSDTFPTGIPIWILNKHQCCSLLLPTGKKYVDNCQQTRYLLDFLSEKKVTANLTQNALLFYQNSGQKSRRLRLLQTYQYLYTMRKS